MRRWLSIIALAAIAAAAAPRAARAGGAVEELSAGGALAGSRWIGDKLAAIWDIDAGAQLRLDVSATRMYDGATGAATGEAYLAALSAVYSTDDHWSLRLSGAWSPETTTRATAYPGAADAGATGSMADRTVLDEAMLTDAELRITASSLAFGAGLDYDSASDGLHSPSASLSFNATYFHAEQEITGAHDGSDELDPIALRARCAAYHCGDPTIAALWPQWVQLGQFALGASVTDTVDRDTDLSLDAVYYLYDRDPMQPGYRALSTLASSTLGSATSAPLLRQALTPSVAHRWGRGFRDREPVVCRLRRRPPGRRPVGRPRGQPARAVQARARRLAAAQALRQARGQHARRQALHARERGLGGARRPVLVVTASPAGAARDGRSVRSPTVTVHRRRSGRRGRRGHRPARRATPPASRRARSHRRRAA
jgi:hypothetical protein